MSDVIIFKWSIGIVDLWHDLQTQNSWWEGPPIDTRVAFKRIAFNGFADVTLNESNAVNNDFIVNESRLYWSLCFPNLAVPQEKATLYENQKKKSASKI
ncbi:hypothetical protein BpHYR1_003387 [Brachionus plicatilis]|uniref:Uncharacterized protein n=1 Tax=Brachionus plicatilis TaxID=10195 RepID=A0A3M7SYF5_BRAPC|nr:hypothetical protein BpHYR1_003387 [Brachionus plicatilis]